jgi:hypothetical protein
MSYSKAIYEIFQKDESSELIRKLDTKFDFYRIDNELIITTITDEIKRNSYVASPYAMIINYSEDELVKIESRLQRAFSHLLIKTFASFLRYTKIDKVQTLNNYMLSTNFFSKKWEGLDVQKLEKKAIERYPKHTLLIRSVNTVQSPKLFENLSQSGWMPIVSRQVYLFDNKEKWRKSRNTINDKKLLDDKRFEFCKVLVDDSKAFERAEALYGFLYLQKYSEHNIQFTAQYLQRLAEEKLLTLYLLRDRENMSYVGVVGMTEEEGVITVPIVGYDMTYTQKEALYRRLMIFATSYAMERDCLLNLSSGAPQFKTLRGGRAELEYMFVRVKHLSFRRRMGWYLISFLSNYFYAPLLKRLKL